MSEQHQPINNMLTVTALMQREAIFICVFFFTFHFALSSIFDMNRSLSETSLSGFQFWMNRDEEEEEEIKKEKNGWTI